MVKARLGVVAGTLIFSIFSALYPSAVLANQQRSFPFSAGQPVTLNAGDSAIITLSLTTTDPDENGEGEGIVMSGAAGSTVCATTVTDYFAVHVIDCGPVPQGEQLTLNSGYLGFDGDELAIGYAQINTPEAVKKTQQEIDAWERIAHSDDALAQMYDTLKFICQQNAALLFVFSWRPQRLWSNGRL